MTHRKDRQERQHRWKVLGSIITIILLTSYGVILFSGEEAMQNTGLALFGLLFTLGTAGFVTLVGFAVDRKLTE